MSTLTVVYFLFIVLINFNSVDNFNLGTAVGSLIHKAKDFYKKHFDKDIKWQFAGYDLTEYPGRNDTEYLEINRAKWNLYYQCLEEQEKSLENGSLIPEAVLLLKGQLIKFDCKACLSPSELDDIESVEWYFSLENSSKLHPVDITEHILISPQDKSLNLYNVQPDQTGQYLCKLKNRTTSPYFLTVTDVEPIININKSTWVEEESQSFGSKDGSVIVGLLWNEWSKCSHCNRVGKRHKYGYCTIVLGDQDIDFNSSEKMSINPDLLELLKVFKFGIPCRSHILPQLDLPLLPSKVMTGFCKVPCDDNKVFVVKDKEGRVVEVANNSGGEYSMLQGRPKERPPIQNELMYEETGSTVKLACPGNLNEDAPVEWQISNKRLLPDVVSQESNGRIQVNEATNEVVIKKAQVSDSDIYSCWQNDELAGTITLIVDRAFKLKFDHHEMIFGIVLVLGTLFYVLIKAIMKGRK